MAGKSLSKNFQEAACPMAAPRNHLANFDTEEEESSSLELELVVDKGRQEEENTELAFDSNIYNFDPEIMKDRPWLKPGANISDYFNYGFTEKTWMKYCEMQRENKEFASRYNKFEKPSGEERFPKRRRGEEDGRRRGEEDGRRRDEEGSYTRDRRGAGRYR